MHVHEHICTHITLGDCIPSGMRLSSPWQSFSYSHCFLFTGVTPGVHFNQQQHQLLAQHSNHVYSLTFSSYQNYQVPYQQWISRGRILCYLKLSYRCKLLIVLTMLWYGQGKCVCLCFPLRIYHLIWDSKRGLKSIISGTANRPKIIHTNQKSILKLLIACKFVSNKTKNPYLFLCHLHQSENKLNLDCSQSR